MKNFIFLLAFPLALHAQSSSNYYALSYSNNIAHQFAKQEFFAGSAVYTDTTNLLQSATGISGYIYPSNFTGVTTWAFPSRIILTTNALISWTVLTTNTATVVAGTYKVRLFTNNLSTAFYDSGDVTWFGVVAPYNSTLQTVTVTNKFPVNTLTQKSNIVSATVQIKIGPTIGDWFTSWITGGRIEF